MSKLDYEDFGNGLTGIAATGDIQSGENILYVPRHLLLESSRMDESTLRQ